MHPHPDAGRDPFRRLRTTRDLDRHDAAEARVPDPFHGWVAPQPGGELGGVRLRALDPQVQGAQPAQRQPDLERPGDRAVQRAVGDEALVVGATGIRARGDHRAEQHVAVAGEVLGHRVDDDVGAQLERALAQGGGEGVVDHRGHPALARRREQGRQVGDLEQGVRRRLQPEQVRTVEGVEHGLRVGDVDPPHDGRAVGLAGVERADDAVVRGVRSDDGAAVGEQRERRGHGGHAGGQDQRVPSLEVAERRLEGAPRGVAGPRVHHVPAGVVGRAEDERCTHLPARRHRFAAQGDDAGRGGEPAAVRRRQGCPSRPSGYAVSG